MKLIATFRCAEGVTEANCYQGSGEVLQLPAIYSVVSPLVFPSHSLHLSLTLALSCSVPPSLHITL